MADNGPLVSVVVPTLGRPGLLRRAVDSVFRQTWRNWELIVSDDETSAGETWEYLCGLAARYDRVHAVKNNGRHGQAGNVNNAMRFARGKWIKPLYDDDVLLSECLETFMAAVQDYPDVVLAGCLAHRFRHGRYAKTDRAPTRKRVEIVEQRYAHLAMYYQDLGCGGMPSQMLVRTSAVHAGAEMPVENGQVHGAVDQFWFADLLCHGDRLHLAVPLVEEHQGGHDTVTSVCNREDVDREQMLLREHLYRLVPEELRPAPLATVRQMVLGIRGLHRLRTGHPVEALRLLARVRRPRAAWLVGKWVARKLLPGRFTATPRLRTQHKKTPSRASQAGGETAS